MEGRRGEVLLMGGFQKRLLAGRIEYRGGNSCGYRGPKMCGVESTLDVEGVSRLWATGPIAEPSCLSPDHSKVPLCSIFHQQLQTLQV